MLFALALSLAPLVPGHLAGPQEPRPLESSLVEVTVYGGSASVRRRATLPALEGGAGVFVLAGLPAALDPDSVRVRLEGGEVVSVEVRERVQAGVPDERLQELRERILAHERELSALGDQAEVQRSLLDHVERLLRQEEGAHAEELRSGRANPEAWEANFRYLAGKLGELKQALRELEPRRQELTTTLSDLRLELGRFESVGAQRLRDLILDVVADAGSRLAVDYVVSQAGWEPYYDLRARMDLSAVELAYRARVWQRTGEDWKQAEILLSTAQPQRGTQGPEPRPVWLSLFDPRTSRGKPAAAMPARELGYSGDDAIEDSEKDAKGRASPFASVESEGLSVRFRLPRKETIESRPEPTTVLIGRQDLALVPEHYCVPAQDTSVWLRAQATNQTEWVLLPGRAAVYFGADFIGQARLDAVQPNQEFTLHLGVDPGLTVKRTQLENLREGSGVFSSRATQKDAWRIELENAGAFSSRPDGSVEVIVQEVLPRARDERIKVSIERAEPKLAEGPRWKKEHEEQGALTWVVRVPRGGKALIQLATEIVYPEDMTVLRQ